MIRKSNKQICAVSTATGNTFDTGIFEEKKISPTPTEKHKIYNGENDSFLKNDKLVFVIKPDVTKALEIESKAKMIETLKEKVKDDMSPTDMKEIFTDLINIIKQ